MFTGIVQSLCKIEKLERRENLLQFCLDMQNLAEGLALGASVAVNGVCLTVVSNSGTSVSFDVIQETLDLTNLNQLHEGALVNVERSFRHGDEVGGHIVSGHVSCCVSIKGILEANNLREITFSVDAAYLPYLMHKGFVALDGASLTISSVDRSRFEFSVSLIPETIARTTLGMSKLVAGDKINLEIDSRTQSIVDTVREMLRDPELMQRLA